MLGKMYHDTKFSFCKASSEEFSKRLNSLESFRKLWGLVSITNCWFFITKIVFLNNINAKLSKIHLNDIKKYHLIIYQKNRIKTEFRNWIPAKRNGLAY
jgi:hypothetical protein